MIFSFSIFQSTQSLFPTALTSTLRPIAFLLFLPSSVVVTVRPFAVMSYRVA